MDNTPSQLSCGKYLFQDLLSLCDRVQGNRCSPDEGWAGHVVRIVLTRNSCTVLIEILQKCVKPDDERNMDSGGLELRGVVGLMK
jgi:hypothetical protein